MKAFHSKTEKLQKEYCLIGLSKFNYAIGKVLIKEGHKVTVLDADPKKINTLGSEFHAALECDCTNIRELSDIGVQHFDYVILGISDMETSVITAANLKELRIDKILCKAQGETHQRILKFLGIDISFVPEEEIAAKVAYRAMYDLDVESFSFDEDSTKETLVIRIPAYSQAVINKKVSEIKFLRNMAATIISIKRKEGEIRVPVSGNDSIHEGDVVCLLCKQEHIKKIKEMFDVNNNIEDLYLI